LTQPLDHSAVAELVDVILVALGLRVVALVLYPPQTHGRPKLLVLAAELPEPAERGAFLASRTPAGSLGDAEIVLKTPGEFAAEPLEDYAELAAGGRILTDRAGIVMAKLR
jgi:hypothetical protein